MAFVELHYDGVRQRPGRFVKRLGGHLHYGAFGNQHGHAGSLRNVILVRDIQNMSADNFGNGAEDFRQAVGIVLVVDIGDISFAFLFGPGVANIVHIEA
ncbi:hypothetical protein D3C81_1403730 [compost metagenome]